MTSTFNHVGLAVADLGRSRAFYEQALGFQQWFELEPPDVATSTLLGLTAPVGLHAVYLVRDGLVLELLAYSGREVRGQERAMDHAGLTHLSLAVTDLDAALAACEANGGSVVAGQGFPGVVSMVRDPDGQLVELTTQAFRDSLPPRPDR